MPEPAIEYDVFLSHANEDSAWCEKLAQRLRDEGVRVWFDKWHILPGDNIPARLNAGIKQSRKMIALFTKNYFRDNKVWTRAESFANQYKDVLAEDRPLIPVLLQDCEPEPLLAVIRQIDFRNAADFDLRFRELVQALDLQTRTKTLHPEAGPFMFEGPLFKTKAPSRFDDEIAKLYRVLGFTVEWSAEDGEPFYLKAEKREGGADTKLALTCNEARVTDELAATITKGKKKAPKTLKAHQWIAVAANGFSHSGRELLNRGKITCLTYSELLTDLLPLEDYARRLIHEYDAWRDKNWQGNDWFIRPNLMTDGSQAQRIGALEHIAKWVGKDQGNLLVILGDLGTGKSTLARFLAYDQARSFCIDPRRHPAPLLIPLKDVRKETSLESIIISHFAAAGLSDISFTRFHHLLRLGKIIVFFDAFDEMADRVHQDVTLSNFRELRRAAEQSSKVIITCRTHYFRDRKEQSAVISEGYRPSETETYLLKETRQQSGAEVVYLEGFDDLQIQAYLRNARTLDWASAWDKIKRIHNLKDLANRPLLLEMIVESLDEIQAAVENAASLYTTYTGRCVKREIENRRWLDEPTIGLLMSELAWRMWRDGTQSIYHREISAFVSELVTRRLLKASEDDIADIARETQIATFLRRDAEGNFSFMHRSIMEFFLARKLFDTLSVPEDTVRIHVTLDANRLDRKVIYFLTLLDGEDRIREPLQRILTSGYLSRISENALQILYWSKRIQLGMEDKIPNPAVLREKMSGRVPPGAVLREARLQEIVLEAGDFSNADFEGADLTGAKFGHARLSGCNFYKARLEAARLDNATISVVSFRDADITGASFDGANIEGADFTGAYGERISAVGSLGEQVKRVAAATAAYSPDNLTAVVQHGHASEVAAVVYSPNGELIASCEASDVILIRRTADGRLLRALEGHTSWVRSVAFSPDGESLASGSSDKSVMLWDVKTGRALRALEGHTTAVNSVAFSLDGESLASGGSDDSVRLWEAKTGRPLKTLEGRTNRVMSVAFSPDGKSLASGGSDKSVRLWEVETGRPLRALEGHKNSVTSVAFSPDGESLASGSSDKSVILWEVKTGRVLRALEWHKNGVTSVAFSSDGESLASGSDDKSVRLWEVKTGRPLRALEGHRGSVKSVAFSPDGESLASGSDDQSVRLWEVKTGRPLRFLEGHTSWVRSVAFSPDGESLASGSYDKSVRLWEMKSVRALEGHTSPVTSVAFSPDGETLASGSSDKSVKLWEVKTGRALLVFEGHTDLVMSVAFSPDGQSLASGSSDKVVRLWEVKTGRALLALDGHTDWVMSVAFSPDGESLASGGSDNSVRLWKVKTGRALRALEEHTRSVMSVAFSPDGESLVSGSSDKSVRLWEVKTGSPIRTLEGHTNWVMSVAFSPDGESLASGSYDNSVRLWEVKTGRLIRTLEGNLGAVYACSFAPNGKYLIAAGSAGRLQFWDVETGETFLYRYSFGSGEWLDLLPDGRFDASPEGMRYLCYTQRDALNSYTAESLVKVFYDPQTVQDVLARYTPPSPLR
jgi:WD40 repeat protein